MFILVSHMIILVWIAFILVSPAFILVWIAFILVSPALRGIFRLCTALFRLCTALFRLCTVTFRLCTALFRLCAPIIPDSAYRKTGQFPGRLCMAAMLVSTLFQTRCGMLPPSSQCALPYGRSTKTVLRTATAASRYLLPPSLCTLPRTGPYRTFSRFRS